MKLTKMLLITAALLLGAAPGARAQAVHVWDDPSGWWCNHFVYKSDDIYTDNELSLDAYGSYWAPEEKFSHLFQTSIRSTGIWGGGLGLNYYFIRYVGIGVDASASDHNGNFVDHVLGNALLRFPIPHTGIAPYVYGGGGRGFWPGYQYLWDFGTGLEFRFNPTTGLFGDARYIWADKLSDSLQIRFGLRFIF